jgi:hypothetical protein
MASVWPCGDNAGGQVEVKIKQVFTPVHEIMKLPGCGEDHNQSLDFSA